MNPSTRRPVHLVLEVVLDRREALEVGVDELLRLVGRDAEPGGEAPGVHPVGEAVVHGLRAPAHLGVDVLRRQAEDRRGGGGVDVEPGVERLTEPGVSREVREDAELDLRVVGHEQDLVVGRRG